MADKEPTYQEIEQDILAEITAAKEYADLKVTRRNQSWDRYYGELLGNEVKGRSRFITREVMDTIEWMMPYFMRTFASGDSKIDLYIEGQEPWIGKALMDEITKRLGRNTPTLFLLFYTWFKDALVSDTSFVKLSWDIDYEESSVNLPEVSELQMAQMQNEPNVSITGKPKSIVNENRQIVYSDVGIKVRRKTRDEISIDNTPHWEFIADPLSKDINDEFGKGHRTEVSLDYLKRINRARGGDYFHNLGEIQAGTTEDTSQSDTYLEAERAITGGDPVKPDDPKARLKYVEWYTKYDVDNDGYLEDIICYFANDKLIRWEENEEGFIPFSAVKPIIDCFKFYGISYGDLIIEIQNLKTMLIRRILDNFDFQNSGRWLVDPGANVNRRELLDNRPGSIVTGKADGVQNLFSGAFNPGSLSILEYVDTIKENRTGITRYNQGTDAESLNRTATGVVQIQNAAMQRLELIGRIYAETGLKDFYFKAARLFQIYAEPFTVKVYGEERKITKDMLQGRIVTNVNMGVEATVGAQEFQKIQTLGAILMKFNEMYPGLIGPEQIHNIARRCITSVGFKQYDDFIADMKTFTTNLQKNAQAQQQMQARMAQMQEQIAQMDMDIKKQEVDVKAQKATQDGRIRSAGVIQKDTDSKREYDLGVMKTILDSRKERASR